MLAPGAASRWHPEPQRVSGQAPPSLPWECLPVNKATSHSRGSSYLKHIFISIFIRTLHQSPPVTHAQFPMVNYAGDPLQHV